MKTYKDENGEHRFDAEDNYLGWWDGYETSIFGAPFTEWEKWDEEKHKFLLSLGFETVPTNL